jgi:hypothetical protein
MYPWGEGELVGHDGPRKWQAQFFTDLGDRLRRLPSDDYRPIRMAVSSGHDIGKSAALSMVILWGLSTMPDTRIAVTAGTMDQLKKRLWPELSKWHRRALNKNWFDLEAESLASSQDKHRKTWRCDIQVWSKERPESLQGLHNIGKRIIVMFDEASQIPEIIWDSLGESSMTDAGTELIFLATGNPTRNTGRFRSIFGSKAHLWNTRQIDSMTVEGTNKATYQQWIDEYGWDSDYVRVRVRGVFPAASPSQFISGDLVAAARACRAEAHHSDPVIMGVDVAREGDDESVICVRAGLDAVNLGWKCLRVPDTMLLVGHITEMARGLEKRGVKIAQISVDPHNMGIGVVDRLRQLGWPTMAAYNWPDPSDPEFHNPSDRWWSLMREWLKNGAIPPGDEVLADQLTGREMGFDGRSRVSLEKKKDMKARGLSSPDRADALALTFAFPAYAEVAGKPRRDARRVAVYDDGAETENDFDPFQ